MPVFLFTDIEGSTRLWEEHTHEMGGVIARHDALLQRQITESGGRITKHTGDGITAAFEDGEPVTCALETQKQFAAEDWGAIGELRIRVGLHAGAAEWLPGPQPGSGDYHGPPVNCTARIMSAAWGGQILLTPEVTDISRLPPQATLADLGQHLLKDVSAPQQIYQLRHPELPRQEFPPPRSLSGSAISRSVREQGQRLADLSPAVMAVELVGAALLPTLQGDLSPSSPALTGNLGVLGDLGADTLRDLLADFAQRLHSRQEAGETLTELALTQSLEGELLDCWQTGGEAAAALRADASRLLQAVGGVEAALEAAAADIKETLVQSLADLGGRFGEFQWMLDGLQQTLAEMRARQALQLALQREQLDLQRQQLVKTNLLLRRQQEGVPVFLPITAMAVEEIDEELPPADVPCPYKGLAAFEPEDADYFFGREALVAELTARLAGTRFLAVVGPSGSGKSSVVRAGLVPALWGDALPGSQDWQTLVLTPGEHPLEELAIRISLLRGIAPGSLLQDLRSDPQALHLAVKQALADEPDQVQLLLVVDQFEEVFALCRNEAERRAFIDALLYAVEDESSRTLVVPTIRADFYGHCADYPDLAARLRDNVLVGPLGEEELRQAIERPAELVGLRLEPGLAETIIGDVADEPGALPLMSHALLETWERRRGHTLTLSGYAASGGVAGAIAQTADTMYGQLSPEEQAIVRGIFLRLTELGEEGTQDTRRRASPAELIRSPEEAPAVEAVLRTLAGARLITMGEDTVEVAHEALIREWPTLREWLEEDREGLRVHRHLTETAGEWGRLERDPGELYRGARLATASEWAEAHGEELNPLEREFLAASQELARRQEAEREAQRQRELEAAQRVAEAERRRAEEQAQNSQRLRRRALLLAGVLAVAVILAVVALLAGQQASRNATAAQAASTQAVAQQATAEAEAIARATQQAVAEEQARLATARELSAAALAHAERDPERSILLALQAVTTTAAMDDIVLPEAWSALHQAAQASHVQRTLGGHTDVVAFSEFSPDGSHIATADSTGTVKLWDAASGQELFTLPAHDTWLNDLTFSADGSRLATTALDNTVKVWDVGSGEELYAVDEPGDCFLNASCSVAGFSPDGQHLVTANQEGTINVRDAASGEVVATLDGHEDVVTGLEFSPDGQYVATSSADGTATVWNWEASATTASMQELLTLDHPEDIVYGVHFSPDGSRLLTGIAAGARMWDMPSGQELLTLEGSGEYAVPIFSPDGTRLVLIDADRTVGVLDAASGEELYRLICHPAPNWLAVSPDGTRLLASGEEGTAKVCDLSPDRELLILSGHPSVTRLRVSPGGTRLATAGVEGSAKVWDLASGQELLTLAGHEDWVEAVAFSPDGDRLATASSDGTAKVWDLSPARDTGSETSVAATSGQELLTLVGHEGPVFALSFSPDGTRLATIGADETVKVWDAESGQELLSWYGHDDFAFGLAFSPDGSRLTTIGTDEMLKVWDAATGQEITSIATAQLLYDLAMSRDGSRLVTGNRDGTATVWDLSTGEALQTLGSETTPIVGVALSPDETRLATGSFDGSVRVWDLSSGQELYALSDHTEPVWGLAFSPDGSRLVSGSWDGTARVYAAELEDLIALAQSRLTRTWTPDECQRFLHVDECP
jgi:WD40 repeat protein/class 3 adenylate cyclase